MLEIGYRQHFSITILIVVHFPHYDLKYFVRLINRNLKDSTQINILCGQNLETSSLKTIDT